MIEQSSRLSLSILIPHFNQGREAAATLDHIASQTDAWGGSLEVVLSDNSSDPEHISLIQGLGQIYPWFKIFRQEHNLGFRGNVGFLAQKARFESALILGCGDQVDLAGVQSVFTEMERLNLEPTILVSRVTSHRKLSDRFIATTENPIVEVRNWLSRWVPYQEAIPGQIFKTSALKSQWIATGTTGNTWPHIEMAFRIISDENALIARTNVALVSMHQSSTGWYFRPGANIAVLSQHLVLLFLNLNHGLGVWVKLGILVSQGLFQAVRQDLTAIVRTIRGAL